MDAWALAKRLARRELRRRGLDVVRYTAERFPELRRLDWIQRSEAGTVIDVGANGGQWASALRSAGYAGPMVSFEPLAEAFETLSQRTRHDPLWTAHRMAIGEFDGESTIQVASNSWSSSLLPMEERHLTSAPESRYRAIEKVVIQRLDTVVPTLGLPERLFVKIDVQGYELKVLEGAESVFDDVVMFELELSLVPLYTGQALLPELVTYLAERDFDLVAATPGFADPVTAQVLQVDGVFCRRG